MNLSLNWMQDYVDASDISLKKFCDEMTMSGSKVESWETLGEDIDNVVLGVIKKIEKHPDSDHLQICMLDDGEEELRQIVTGAQNVFEGAVVPVAKAPAKLPGGVVIKAGKLRGVDSNGMLCSIGELGLTEHDMPGANNNGIFILNGVVDGKPGDDLKDLLMLNDRAVEFEITSNRPDCMSVIGLAREAAVTFGKEFKPRTPIVTEKGGNIADYLSVKVENTDLCPRYMARVIRNVKIAPSPLWMRMRLRASGVRPINNVVDITNYVMLEYGQPMHAFDYSMLTGKEIVVRLANEGENFRSLDSVDHVLNARTLVISDQSRAVALAGVMGGENSEIKDDTKTVVFECANFDGATVRLGAKAQGMRTESSGRFEKGLDPENCKPALDRACELIELLGAGEVVSGEIDKFGKKKAPVVVKTSGETINHFLGTDATVDFMVETFEKLEVKVEKGENGELTLTAPSFRNDLACMQDYAEEIARIYGYNKIASTPFKGNVAVGALTPKQAFVEDLHETLLAMGLSQSITFSFVSPKDLDKIRLAKDDPKRRQMTISNPLGEDTSVMRVSLLPGLLSVLSHNNNHHSDGVAMYELAHIYLPKDDPELLPDEPLSLALGFYGKGDFYDLKGMVEAIIEKAGIAAPKFVADANNPTFHPGRCADVIVRGFEKIATIGQIHPKVADNYGIDQPVYIAEIDVEKLFAFANFKKQYKQLPKFPGTSRDFAFVVDEALEAGTIEDAMKKAGGKSVEKVELFDVYRGDKMPAGKKSMALRVYMRAQDHTITLDEAQKISEKILAALEKQLGISLRS